MGMTEINKDKESTQTEESYPVKFEEIETTKDLLTMESVEFPANICIYLSMCPPCASLKESLDNSTFNKPILLYRVNLVKDSWLREECKVMAAPTFLKVIKKDGKLELLQKESFSNIGKFCDFFNLVLDDDF